MLAHIADAADDPLDVALGAARNVAEQGGVVRPHDGEEVGEARELHAEIRFRPVGPMLLKRYASLAADIDPQEFAGDAVKTGGIDNGVERVRVIPGFDAGGCDPRDWCRAQIDQGDVGAIESFVVILFAGTTLGAEGVALRDQFFGRRWISDPGADLRGEEFGDFIGD